MRQLDVITLRGLSAPGVHGVLEHEQRSSQPFSVDVAMWVATDAGSGSDNIADTVSYADIADEVSSILTGPSVRLIETLAHRIARAVIAHNRIEAVEVTVHKPHAPIPYHFQDVFVTVRMGSVWGDTPVGTLASVIDEDEAALRGHTPGTDERASSTSTTVFITGPESPAESARQAVLALGGNLGDTPTILAQAISDLIDTRGIDVENVSPILRTRPVLRPDQAAQNDYWNAVVLVKTRLQPRDLLAVTQRIEAAHGRIRQEKWGPRTLDIDIIQYEGVTQIDPELTLPHPRVRQRAFVLAPWLLVDPEAELEGKGRVEDLLELTPDREGIRDAVEGWLDDPSSVIAESDAVLNDVADEIADDGDVEESGDSLVIPHLAHAGQLVAQSRLDLVPEASRVGLEPGEGGDDLVWRRLWEKWGTTSATDRDAREEPAPVVYQKAPASLEPAWTPSVFLTDGERGKAENTGASGTASQRSGAREDVGLTAQPAEPRAIYAGGAAASGGSFDTSVTPVGVDAGAVAPGESSVSGESQSVQRRTTGSKGSAESEHPQSVAPETRSDAGESTTLTPEKRRPRWLPVFDEEKAHEGHEGSEGTLQLPSWDFAHHTVRIFDDPDAAPLGEAPAGTPAQPVRRSILDPMLPQGTPIGPVSEDETAQTGIIRKAVIRPTALGQVEISRHKDPDQ
ncbi:2-amino-4-hydroxy-6-hydroxymethyldihydropteridine diphosphokinase [Schaalia sp. ZJ405]|uniref:2-amino-4-hydroxy-6- hydroxymethyldihydropteridine diphosphokinase n=1 Tax=Schaalia sp. ZJ405 TaxID=2709403 RepID=UPI001E2B3837|nr:2-amino-4-hydroxy-6-hydroxymethyldihydropteridine diphosphokinase [Schaalia sp. ZJ405]